MPITSPDSLFYPDDTTGQFLSAQLSTLAGNIQSVFTASTTWTSWTPTFDLPNHCGFSNMGTGGHKAGHYIRSRPGIGALIYAEFRFVLGTGFTAPTGGSTDTIFVLLLPVLAHAWAGQNQNQTIGRWTLRDDVGTVGGNPVPHQSGTLGLFDSSDSSRVHFADANDRTSPINMGRRIDVDDPLSSYAVDDILTGHLLYRSGA